MSDKSGRDIENFMRGWGVWWFYFLINFVIVLKALSIAKVNTENMENYCNAPFLLGKEEFLGFVLMI